MIGGINPTQLKSMMRQMGMSQRDIEANEVVIKTRDKVYIFKNPQVQKISMQGNESFQIVGEYEVLESEVNGVISEDDVKTVCEQANVSADKAREALEKSKGDIAQAIVDLS